MKIDERPVKDPDALKEAAIRQIVGAANKLSHLGLFHMDEVAGRAARLLLQLGHAIQYGSSYPLESFATEFDESNES